MSAKLILVYEARMKVVEIADLANDPETAHSRLDDLLERIVETIAVTDDIEKARALADVGRAAFLACPIRWCA